MQQPSMLRVLKFSFNPFQENTYILANSNNECAIIDPGCYDSQEENLLKNTIEEEGLTPILLLNTHCHLDHVFGNAFIAKEYDLTPKIHHLERAVFDNVARVAEMYGLSYNPSPQPSYYKKDYIFLGDDRLDLLFVPGHSPGHVAIYSANDELLISGDVIFKESIGRTDLPGGDMQTLMESIEEKILGLPENTKVYPGHMDTTTISAERLHNPFLRKDL